MKALACAVFILCLGISDMCMAAGAARRGRSWLVVGAERWRWLCGLGLNDHHVTIHDMQLPAKKYQSEDFPTPQRLQEQGVQLGRRAHY